MSLVGETREAQLAPRLVFMANSRRNGRLEDLAFVLAVGGVALFRFPGCDSIIFAEPASQID
jgi:hypothetical protein